MVNVEKVDENEPKKVVDPFAKKTEPESESKSSALKPSSLKKPGAVTQKISPRFMEPEIKEEVKNAQVTEPMKKKVSSDPFGQKNGNVEELKKPVLKKKVSTDPFSKKEEQVEELRRTILKPAAKKV